MKSPRIVVVGSFNMDLVVSTSRMPLVGETITGQSIHYIPGGKGANQAVGCARLGAVVHMVGAVGDDLFGRQIFGEMEQIGIRMEHVAVVPNVPTGTATILHTQEDNCIVIVPGANGKVTPEHIESSRRIIEQADVLLVQLEIPIESVERALQIARASGVKTVLNPAPAISLPSALIKLADYVTPNETEFALLMRGGKPEEPPLEDLSTSMSIWQERYDNMIIVTRGTHGASYCEGDQLRTVPALKVEAVDTTGAGDCLNAAFGFGIASGWSLEQSLSFAVKAASVSVTRFGAQAGMPSREEVEHAER